MKHCPEVTLAVILSDSGISVEIKHNLWLSVFCYYLSARWRASSWCAGVCQHSSEGRKLLHCQQVRDLAVVWLNQNIIIRVATLNKTELYKDWEMGGHIQNNVCAWCCVCLFIYKDHLQSCSEVMIAGLNLFRGSAVWALASWAESGLLTDTRWGLCC